MKIENRDINHATVDNKQTSNQVVETQRVPNQELHKNLSVQDKNLMPISERSIIDAIEKANKVMINTNTRAEFTVHEKTKDIMIKIINTDSNEVIREFPHEKILDMVAKMWEMAGLFVDERR